MGEKQTVQVTIFHQTYTLRATGEEREVQELADTVDRLMSAIASRSASADSLRVAVLACLHLADRLRAVEGDIQEVRRKCQELQELLEKALRPDHSGARMPE